MNRKTSGVLFACAVLGLFFLWRGYFSDTDDVVHENEQAVAGVHSRTAPLDQVSPTTSPSPLQSQVAAVVASNSPSPTPTPFPSTSSLEKKTVAEKKPAPENSIPLDQIGWNGKCDPNGRHLGWIQDGKALEDYDLGVGINKDGDHEAFIHSKVDAPQPFASLTDILDFSLYAGNDIQISAEVMISNTVPGGVSLYARTNDAHKKILSFNKTLLKRGKEWQTVSVKLSVPQETQEFFFGLMMNGKGSVVMRNVTIEPNH